MVQRIIIFIFTSLVFVSCDFFQKKELNTDEVVDTIIDYKSIDNFPLFPDCDSIPSSEKQQICSQIKLSESIYASLASAHITTLRTVNDTLYLKLKINSSGEVFLTNYKASEFLHGQIPKLDSLLKKGVSNLPTLKPAIKRGIPVATEFTLPIIVVN